MSVRPDDLAGSPFNLSPATIDNVNFPDDRAQWVPKHQGPNVFPNFFLFGRLLRWSYRRKLVAIKDLTYGYTADYAQLLTDILHLRNVLRQTLPPTIIRKIDRDEEVFINLLGPGGYEFVVGFFALMALGAVIVPISPDLPAKEATYYATKSKSSAVLVAQRSVHLAQDLESIVRKLQNEGFRAIQITSHIMQKPLDPSQIQISSDAYFDLNKSGLVIFTSGTSGPPKGGVKRRGFFYDVAASFSDQHGIMEGDAVLHVLPVHHATGVTVTLIPFLYCGGCIEFRSGGFNVEWTWERIRRGGLSFFSGVPIIYMRLMTHYEQRLSNLPLRELEEYVKGINEFRALLCGTSALPRPLQQKWTKLRGGRAILTRYGGTEFGNAFTVTPRSEGVPDGSVGEKAPGIDLKLSNGDEGEVLMRSPILFSKYLFDGEATRNALDDNGYFKTGDIARREGKYYFILGRASIDIIKSGGYKISALDIEREILGLEYVAEAMVVGVEDEEFGQRVAAAVVLQPNALQSLTLGKLRHDLRTTLVGYKMPTLLRVVNELKKNATGKVVKKVLVKELFPSEGHQDVQRWESKNRENRL
ncbi:uncharacterized protein Z519_04344 [Cladophialophora bantiana CBS 173.52]|uniref:AMP-dependent synthetase/ligase domain-containing protein n=1 Tax=Cladophialophora bantiana (strain ATCC 10958 / CBS 173.52 / CDC B-1940 / NIH 8579) TaxID=1442370 RepID=A0A0D2HM05_CLAB1|nr:uncharacterized protein Z519_04344 [Cladophialophora bantiana CBS 173.52]KIW94368.1 hypothetical protein Z519_04344 [Cladophialophora bantiana CBS 173.52]